MPNDFADAESWTQNVWFCSWTFRRYSLLGNKKTKFFCFSFLGIAHNFQSTGNVEASLFTLLFNAFLVHKIAKLLLGRYISNKRSPLHIFGNTYSEVFKHCDKFSFGWSFCFMKLDRQLFPSITDVISTIPLCLITQKLSDWHKTTDPSMKVRLLTPINDCFQWFWLWTTS